MKRTRDDDDDDSSGIELPTELWMLIRTRVCADSPAIMRARLRLVCRAWRNDDLDFVTPAWCTTHPDLINLSTSALLIFKDTLKRIAYQNAWANVPVPTKISWTFSGVFSREIEIMRLRFWWDKIIIQAEGADVLSVCAPIEFKESDQDDVLWLTPASLSERISNPDDYFYTWGTCSKKPHREFMGSRWGDANNTFLELKGEPFRPHYY